MAPEKTNALILSVMPYRETSCILRLITPEHGVISVVAKGIRRNDSRAVLIDRGFLLQTLLYIKSNRDLHTCGAIHVADYYPGVRADITKAAIRDAAFELILKTVTQTASHPELYTLVQEFITMLDTAQKRFCFPLLWHLISQFCSAMGFEISSDQCCFCKKPLQGENGYLLIPRGMMACPGCSAKTDPTLMVPYDALTFFNQIDTSLEWTTSKAEYLRITRAMYSYCRYHFAIKSAFNSLEFMETMV
ncbi:DNA recombination and repair protein RecO [Chitinispirillum alkaliphilum]|nr:DNA recombination and repair protein RecO [Chitinispirillum alkaliphilum]